jgi:UDP-glucose:(heptosyl)LPS alpha-1,3-glucosyltransferase
MRIGIVILHCESTRASRYVGEVTKYFAREGHEVHVFANTWEGLDPAVITHKIPVLPWKKYLGQFSFNVLASFLTKLYKLDVTMAQATRYFTPDVCYMQFVYKAWSKVRKGFDNPLPETFWDKAVLSIEGRNLRRSKKIITMAEGLKREMVEGYGLPESKIHVVRSGLDLDVFSPRNRALHREAVRRELGLSEGDIALVFAGNPYGRKGLDFLVGALPLIKDKRAKVVVVGRDMGAYKIKDYQKKAEELGCPGRVVYAGFRSDINRVFAASDIFVFPTLYEPFGLVVTEAMASGLPVVTSACAGAAELIEDGVDGLLIKEPRDSAEIADKVNRLLEGDLAKRMGAAARRKAEQYTWERTAKEMLGVFESARALK